MFLWDFFPSLKQNFIAYRSSKVSDCIFEIHQLLQSGFSRVYSNCWCSCSLVAEIIKISQPSHKMYSNNRVNFQESTTILNAHTKKVWKHRMHLVSWPTEVYRRAQLLSLLHLPLTCTEFSKEASSTIFASLVWLVLGLDPGLLD